MAMNSATALLTSYNTSHQTLKVLSSRTNPPIKQLKPLWQNGEGG
jgi:hypothetical protein